MRLMRAMLLSIALWATTCFGVDLVVLSLPSLPYAIYNQQYNNVELRVTNGTRGPMYLNYLYDTQYPVGFTANSSTCNQTQLAQGGHCSVYGTYIPTVKGQNTWTTKVAINDVRYTPGYSVSTTVFEKFLNLYLNTGALPVGTPIAVEMSNDVGEHYRHIIKAGEHQLFDTITLGDYIIAAPQIITVGAERYAIILHNPNLLIPPNLLHNDTLVLNYVKLS